MSFDIARIQKSNRKLSKVLQKNSKRPSSKAVHNLRTNARRLAAIFSAFELDSNGKAKRALRILDKIRKKAGKVRDMDVLTANTMAVEHPPEEVDCHVQLLEHLGAERERYARKLHRAIQRNNPELRRNLKRISKRAEALAKKAKGDPADSNAIPSTIAKSIELSLDLNGPARFNRKNLHPYRLQVKELLSVLQLSEQPADPQFLTKLAEVKDAIGEWHDWQQLAAVARELSSHAASCQLIKSLEAQSEARYKRALTLTNHLRDTYFRTAGKGKSKRAAEKKVSDLVVREAAAIVH